MFYLIIAAACVPISYIAVVLLKYQFIEKPRSRALGMWATVCRYEKKRRIKHLLFNGRTYKTLICREHGSIVIGYEDHRLAVVIAKLRPTEGSVLICEELVLCCNDTDLDHIRKASPEYATALDGLDMDALDRQLAAAP